MAKKSAGQYEVTMQFTGKVADNCSESIFMGNTNLYHFESIEKEGTYTFDFNIISE